MVATSDIILGSGLLLGVLYLKKRSDQVSTIAPLPYYEQVEAVNLERLTQFGSRIEQLKDIRSQILEFEKGETQQKVSFLQAQIDEARQVASQAQAYLARPRQALSQTAARKLAQLGGNLQAAYSALSSGTYKERLQAPLIGQAIAGQQYYQQLQQALQFEELAQTQISELKQEYAELEQIV